MASLPMTHLEPATRLPAGRLRHAALAVIAAWIVPACYQPELLDCVVTCNDIAQCAPGLTCDHGKCAATAGACAPKLDASNEPPGDDAGRDGPVSDAPVDDAPAIDASKADAAIDAPDGMATLTILVVRKGIVVPDGGEPCRNSQNGNHTERCDRTFPVGKTVDLVALPSIEPNKCFEEWEEGCPAKDNPICTVMIPASGFTVKARFKNGPCTLPPI